VAVLCTVFHVLCFRPHFAPDCYANAMNVWTVLPEPSPSESSRGTSRSQSEADELQSQTPPPPPLPKKRKATDDPHPPRRKPPQPSQPSQLRNVLVSQPLSQNWPAIATSSREQPDESISARSSKLPPSRRKPVELQSRKYVLYVCACLSLTPMVAVTPHPK
jgi:hypothetical protein